MATEDQVLRRVYPLECPACHQELDYLDCKFTCNMQLILDCEGNVNDHEITVEDASFGQGSCPYCGSHVAVIRTAKQ